MLRLRRLRSVFRLIVRVVATLLVFVSILAAAGITLLESGWGRNQLRALMVRQGNQYLTARLDIGALSGSLFGGIELGDVRVSKDGRTLISIDRMALSYSIRELIQAGVVIKRASLVRPNIHLTRLADGGWDLASLIKREVRQEESTGPRRPFEVSTIEITDASVTLSDDVAFGAAHIPTRYEGLDANVSFKYVPVQWVLDITRIAFKGSAPDLTMNRLTGRIERKPDALIFDALSVATPRSAFTLAGHIDRGDRPTALDLRVQVARFAFQEWSGIIRGLKDIAVDADFDVTLRGPLAALGTALTLHSNAGDIQGTFSLNTTVPGWLGKGQVDVNAINLARWMNRPDKISDITGRVTFDLAFGFGQHFPRGSYAFDGPHAMYMNYAGDQVHARGVLTANEAVIAEASAISYGAAVHTADGTIGLREPYPYHFPGTIASLDLRGLPDTIPVVHVQSDLALAYDVQGTFKQPFIRGTAQFARSTFLGATIAEGTVGRIDTGQTPLTYGGEGEISDVSLGRFGSGLNVDWMKDPRYAGTVDGRFHVDASGSGRESLNLTAGGHLQRASMFGGTFSEAEVSLEIANGTLGATFDGALEAVHPSIALADERLDATLTGNARASITVRDLLRRTSQPADYRVDGTVTLRSSTIRENTVDAATVDGVFKDGIVTVRRLEATGPAFQISGSGSLATAGCIEENPACRSDFTYDITRADLEGLRPPLAGKVGGLVVTKGGLTGTFDRPHVAGGGTVTGLSGSEIRASSLAGTYDLTTTGRFETTAGRVELRAPSMTIGGVSLTNPAGTVVLADRRAKLDAAFEDSQGRMGQLAADAVVDLERREARLDDFTLTHNRSPWRLAASSAPPLVSWTADGVTTTAMTLAGPTPEQRLELSGTWRRDGRGALRVVASRVVLDTLPIVVETPARYGGVLTADATIRGTRDAPLVDGQIEVTDGRIRRFAYQRLAGRVDYSGNTFSVDLRLDQAPGTWIAAKGTAPAALFDPERPEGAFDLAVTSSPIGLGLLEGLTDLVSNVAGEMQLDVKTVGTSRDPHFEGRVAVTNAAFLVASSGSRYQNGRATAHLARDRVEIEAFHLEDRDGRALDLHGSLGTHEMRVGDLSIDATARRFEVLRNEFGRLEIDANLQLRGKAESPQVVGDLTISAGTLNVDAILDRTLLAPYATVPLAAPGLGVISALNPWNRLALDLSLHIPQELKLVGEDLQVAQGTPIGLGDVNLRVGGDLYLYKDPQDVLSVTGSLDRISGTYRFQGRRFDIDQRGSSITFVGDLNPQLYVQVTREITGVETRVAIIGDLHNPELRLSSSPPLEPSDILALIVFNAPSNSLTVPEQQELAVRAATIAAGFLAQPIVSAIERTLGLDILEIAANEGGSHGTRITVGEEIAPGLVARFSRQFGEDEFNQATVEYSLSRLLRIRATFSDATSATIRSPFRRIERAGIDLLLFFSF